MALPPDDVAGKNKLIEEITIDLLSEKTFDTIHVFLPQAYRNEVNTVGIISTLRRLLPGIVVAIPYVIPGTRQMRHFVFTDETLLKENKWGIPEPDPLHATEVTPKSIDVVLVPLLAFDQHGYRVGYGGGYYDRFLSECRPDVLKIGLSFFDPVERIEDLDQYDVPLDYIVTSERVWEW